MHDNDLETSIDSLLPADYDEPELLNLTREEGAPDGTAPSLAMCKYYLSGSCLIVNCQYSHSRENPEAFCKYWNQGYCARGEACNFTHGSLEDGSAALDSNAFIEEHTHQPVPETKVSVAQDVAPVMYPNRLLQDMQIQNLALGWPQVHREILGAVLKVHGSVARLAEKELETRFGPPRKPSLFPPTRPLSRPSAPSVAPASIRSASLTPVTSGDEIAVLYTEQREAAAEQARLRNECFAQATRAYRAGDKALAKELSRLGHAHDNKMRQLHEAAAERIFRARNPGTRSQLTSGTSRVIPHAHYPNQSKNLKDGVSNQSSLFSNNTSSSACSSRSSTCAAAAASTALSASSSSLPPASSPSSLLSSASTSASTSTSSTATATATTQSAPLPRVVDVHGLHASEALRRVDALLAALNREPSREPDARYLDIITGAGKHSFSKHGGSLRPAVLQFLKARGLSFVEMGIEAGEPHRGTFRVRLGSNA